MTPINASIAKNSFVKSEQGYLNYAQRQVPVNLIILGLGVFVGSALFYWGHLGYAILFNILTLTVFLFRAVVNFRNVPLRKKIQEKGLSMLEKFGGVPLRQNILNPTKGTAIILDVRDTYIRNDEEPILHMKVKLQNEEGAHGVVEIYRPVPIEYFHFFYSGQHIPVEFDRKNIQKTLSFNLGIPANSMKEDVSDDTKNW